jgi:23S rRNA (cytidine1920-2'-O)/16S rRNA (cytidine1409-2'-O)-methyltransferase
VARAAVESGLALRGLAESPLPGQDGNVEYFLWLRRPGADDLHDPVGVEELLNTVWPDPTARGRGTP